MHRPCSDHASTANGLCARRPMLEGQWLIDRPCTVCASTMRMRPMLGRGPVLAYACCLNGDGLWTDHAQPVYRPCVYGRWPACAPVLAYARCLNGNGRQIDGALTLHRPCIARAAGWARGRRSPEVRPNLDRPRSTGPPTALTSPCAQSSIRLELPMATRGARSLANPSRFVHMNLYCRQMRIPPQQYDRTE